jgi:hypothetical protein
MTRNVVNVLRALLWTLLAVDVAVHAALGDWLAPTFAAIAAVGVLALRLVWRRVPRPA